MIQTRSAMKCVTGSGFRPPGNFVNHLKTVGAHLDNFFVVPGLQAFDADSLRTGHQEPGTESHPRLPHFL